MKDVIIIGAGISGLSAGFELHKSDIDFQILECSGRVGGNIQTLKRDDYLVETGPHAFSSASRNILELVNDLELADVLQEANPESRKRYIYHNGQMMPVPAGLKEFLNTELISKDGKMTLLEELFIKKESKEETVEEFINRRFGREVLKNIIQPYLNGLFAGDVQKLSAPAVFPRLKELERKYQSIIVGGILSSFGKRSFKKLTLHSFNEGMETLTKAMYERLKSKISLNVQDIDIAKAKDFFVVNFKVNNKVINYTTNTILFALPAYKMYEFVYLLPPEYRADFAGIEYAPLAVVNQAVKKSKVKIDVSGFGFLCTKEAHRKLLGSIWTSSVFPDRAPSNKILLTSYIGGALYKKIVDQPEEEINALVSKEIAETMKISDQSAINPIHIKVNPYAIPQYNTGHLEKVKRIEELMGKDLGLFFTGNYLRGVSINDSVHTSQNTVSKIKHYLNKVSKTTKAVPV